MNSNKLLLATIENAKRIAISGIRSETTYEAWYQHAESALKKVFGDDWRGYIFWEGYKSESSYEEDLKRLGIAASFIESGKTLVSQPNVKKHQKNKAVSPKEEKSVHQQDLRIFIVHGHDDIAKLELKNYIQNTLKLPEPIILHEQPNHGRAIIEKFEEFANESTLAFVLLTPDDHMAKELGSESKVYRARQNVIFEMGYFLGMFGRKTGRVILLYKGTLDIPSDISGVIYIDISNGIESAGEKIRREIDSYLQGR